MNITRNEHYTFKYNLALGRHGWLRLTPAYSVRLVEEIVGGLDYLPSCIMEPFSGTGTTGLVCANRGIPSCSLEINPFLVWLGNAKLSYYPADKISEFLEIADSLMKNLEKFASADLPPIHNIYRWWGPLQADFLAKLKSAIKTIEDSVIGQLLQVAFCRVIIEISNASFRHVSTSFRDDKDDFFSIQSAKDIFISACEMVAKGALDEPRISMKVIEHDSRTIPKEYYNKYDTVITSPPYPNRISYIRELRPYMYWLDYLKTPSQASNLDWRAIGGTWGKATSLLSTWQRKGILPQYVYKIAGEISNVDNKSANLMKNYVLKYFEDMYEHLLSIYAGLKYNGRVFYIIGNSNFYGITIPSEKIYADIMSEIGFVDVQYQIVRKRNCNKQLYEFVVSGRKTRR